MHSVLPDSIVLGENNDNIVLSSIGVNDNKLIYRMRNLSTFPSILNWPQADLQRTSFTGLLSELPDNIENLRIKG
jgi:hypothetical protein